MVCRPLKPSNKKLGDDAANACWVLALGTNDATAGADDNATVEKALAALDENATVFWPHVYSLGADTLPPERVKSFNDAIDAAAEKDSRVIPVTWADGEEDKKYLGADGIHHSPEGKTAYISALTDAVSEGKNGSGDAAASDSSAPSEPSSSSASTSSATDEPSESESGASESEPTGESSSESTTDSESSSESSESEPSDSSESESSSSSPSESNTESSTASESESASEEAASGLGGLLTDSSDDNSGSESTDNSLANAYAEASNTDNSTTESSTAQPEKKEEVPGLKPVTAKPAPGGGLTGQRDQDFGELAGSVASFCAPGDIFCDLPENSQLARDLAKIGTSVKLPGGIGQTVEGDSRMIGVMTIQAVNYLAELTGLPKSKISPESMNTLIRLAAGMMMVAAGGGLAAAGVAAPAAVPALAAVAGPAAGVVAAGVPAVTGVASSISTPLITQGMKLLSESAAELPKVLPEVAAQIQDLPAILAALPKAPEEFAKNTGADQLVSHLAQGFTGAGFGDITKVMAMPTSSQSLLQSLAQDNTGLMQLATNPQYWTTVQHSEAGFKGLKVNDDQSSWNWSQDWINLLNGNLHAKVSADVTTGDNQSSSATASSEPSSTGTSTEPSESATTSGSSSATSEPSVPSSSAPTSEPLVGTQGNPLDALPNV